MLLRMSKNELIDRLRVFQSRLTDENEHSDAVFVGFAIQVIEETPDTIDKPDIS